MRLHALTIVLLLVLAPPSATAARRSRAKRTVRGAQGGGRESPESSGTSGSGDRGADGPNAKFTAATALLRQLHGGADSSPAHDEIAGRAEQLFDEVFEDVGALTGDGASLIDLLMQTSAEFGKVGLDTQRHRTLRRVAQLGDDMLPSPDLPVATEIRLNKALSAAGKSLDNEFQDYTAAEQAYGALLKSFPPQADPLGDLQLGERLPSADPPDGLAAAKLRAELSQMTMAELHERAEEKAVNEVWIDDAMDSDSPKDELISLLVAHHHPSTTSPPDAQTKEADLNIIRPEGETLARVNVHRSLGNLLQRQGRLSDATYQLASAIRLEVTQFNSTKAKEIIALANLLGVAGTGKSTISAMGRACNEKNCGDADGKPTSWKATSGWTFSPKIADLATDQKLEMRIASEDVVQQWHATDGRRSCRAWRGAVPDEAKRMLSDHMREGPYLADRYSEIANPTYQGGKSQDAGYVSWWAPLSEKDSPSNVLSQIAYEWVLPLLPPSTLQLMEAGGGGVEHWGHTKVSSWKFPFAVAGHQFHFDVDAPRMGKTNGDEFRMPLFTCLFYIDGGGGNGGRLVLLNQSRTADSVEERAATGWVAAPIPGDVVCFDGRLLHAVLPGVLGLHKPGQPAVEESVALDELRALIRKGQSRMSLNLAFWESPCLHDSPICQAKEPAGKASQLWQWEDILPALQPGLWSSGYDVNPTQLEAPSVDQPWVWDPAGWIQGE